MVMPLNIALSEKALMPVAQIVLDSILLYGTIKR